MTSFWLYKKSLDVTSTNPSDVFVGPFATRDEAEKMRGAWLSAKYFKVIERSKAPTPDEGTTFTPEAVRMRQRNRAAAEGLSLDEAGRLVS